MYLHLGQDTVIHAEEMIGIFDLETSTVSKISRDYISSMQKKKYIVNVSMEMPKSFVPCLSKDGKTTVYISQLSSSTLLKRVKNGEDQNLI